MDVPQYSPLRSLVRATGLLLRGRVHFPRQRLGHWLEIDGRRWIIFREIGVDAQPGAAAQPGAVFQPVFHLRGMGARANMLFSWLPILFFIGLPGFRSKLWLYDPRSGDFSGWYHWERVEDARRYRASFAARFMIRRSLPGSVSFRILPAADGGTRV